MAQWDVHLNGSARSQDRVPYVLDIQSDALRRYNTRIVVPLYRRAAFGTPARVLNPILVVAGDSVVAAFDELANFPVSALGPAIGSVVDRREDLIAALDRLFLGL